jgi:hypothetical protein
VLQEDDLLPPALLDLAHAVHDGAPPDRLVKLARAAGFLDALATQATQMAASGEEIPGLEALANALESAAAEASPQGS